MDGNDNLYFSGSGTIPALTLSGGDGNDKLYGGYQNSANGEFLRGGQGNDTYLVAQTGDHTGAGNGGPGYNLGKDELGLEHKWAGTLSMANLGPGTANSQFFVTVKPTPHLDGKHAVFGKCDPKVAKEITQVKVDPRRNSRPYEPIKLERVVIARKK